MNISELELFDVSENGLLVMKTNVDEPAEDLRYAWYVKENGVFIYKSQYRHNPYTAVQLPYRGSYAVTAFVRNGTGEKITKEMVFRADRKTSPLLADKEVEHFNVCAPAVEHISERFWRFHAAGDLPEGARFAWYIYREGVKEPLVRSAYAEEPTYMHKFEAPGNYSVKMFVVVGDAKRSAVGETFTVR